jgi:hypothetical protein
MERDELRFEQDIAYLKSLEEDKKKIAPEPKPLPELLPEPRQLPEPEHEPKLTLQELRAQRIAHFEKH